MTAKEWTFAQPPGVLQPNLTAYSVVSTFSGLALWLCLELLVQILITFRRRGGLYFWSCLLTTMGLLLQTVGFNFLQMFCASCPKPLYTTIGIVGWNMNFSGVSMVLYSRLYLIGLGTDFKRLLLALIIFNGVCLQTPYTIFCYAMLGDEWLTWGERRETMEKVQQVVMSFQESILACVYLFHVVKHMALGTSREAKSLTVIMIISQAFLVCCDITRLSLVFCGLFTLQCILQTFITALKLKLELMFLNELRCLVKHREQESTTQSNLFDTVGRNNFQQIAQARPSPMKTTSSSSDSTLIAFDRPLGLFKQPMVLEDIAELERRYLGRFQP